MIILSSFPSREDLVGMRPHQVLGDQFQAGHSPVRSQGRVWQRRVYLGVQPRGWEPGFESQFHHLVAM